GRVPLGARSRAEPTRGASRSRNHPRRAGRAEPRTGPRGSRRMSFTPTAGIRPGDLDPELRQAVARIARVPHLLVACDYDGTIAPLVDGPTHAVPLPEAVAAIRTLAVLPQTVVAVSSGRSLRDLAAISRLPSEVRLVGSHGSEFDVGFVE